jgi:hypothetical protein
MAIQALHVDIAADAVEFALPLFDQVRRRDDENHLMLPDLPAQLLDDLCGYRNRGRASDQGFADPHLADQQDAVPTLKAAYRRADHMLLCRVHRVLALEPDAIQPASHPGKVKPIHRLELLVEIPGQGTLVGGDEAQQRLIPFHLDYRPILRQQRERGRRFQPDGGLLDLPFRVAGGGFDFHAGDLLDVLCLAANGDLPVVLGLDDRAVGNACRQHQRHVSGTRRDDGFNLFRRTGNVQQRLKAVALPRALLLNQPQPLLFVDDVGRKDKAGDLGWRR